MQITPLKFVLIGFGNAVCANRIVSLSRPDSAAGRRMVKQARETNTYTDMTFGRSLKCLLSLDDGSVIGCGLTCKTIMGRLNATHAHTSGETTVPNDEDQDEQEITDSEETPADDIN